MELNETVGKAVVKQQILLVRFMDLPPRPANSTWAIAPNEVWHYQSKINMEENILACLEYMEQELAS